MPQDEASRRRLVEEQLAEEHGWDLQLFRGASFQLPGLSLRMRAEYAIDNPFAFFPPGQPRLSNLRLTKWLKFGNAVEQLHHLFHLAKTYNVRRIILPPSEVFQARELDEFEVTTATEQSAEFGVGLAGLFYYLEPFCVERPTESLVGNARRYVRPLLSDALQESDPRVGKDDLVLHFRAGDIFQRPVAHYGQPPLAYYLATIAREKPSRAWLVFEDSANPCIQAVEGWLRQRGLEVMIQSGSLEEDLRVLFSASRLVIGQGTFGSSVAMLSSHLRRLYSFKSELWDDLRLPNVEMIQAIDIGGAYTKALLSKNWKASPEQCALMLSYPAEALRFERTASAAS